MADITMQIPDDLQSKLKNNERDVGRTLRLAAAFSLCQRGGNFRPARRRD